MKVQSISRREVLAGAAAVALVPFAARSQVRETLDVTTGQVQIVPNADYPKTEIWGFNGSVPGPTLRTSKGSFISKTLRNRISQPTSVHWHGIRIRNSMDGVPGLTQEPVLPGGDFEYEFLLPDAGTYWYHSHYRSSEQVARGLYGLLIVEESEAVDVDQDIAIVLDDWRLNNTAQIADDIGNMHDNAHEGRIGNFLSAVPDQVPEPIMQNDRLRVRLVNVATDRIMSVEFQGAKSGLIALDGMPLQQQLPADHMVLGPGQRADLLLDITDEPGSSVRLIGYDGNNAFQLLEWAIEGRSSATARSGNLVLPPNFSPKVKTPTAAESHMLIMKGGAMGGMLNAVVNGEKMGLQEMMQSGQVWALNGVAGLPSDPFLTANQTESLRISLRNETAFPHAMHLHGHHFQEVLGDGSLGPFRDTLLVGVREARDIVFVAQNPGDWLIHCHMLGHQAAGMKTWIKVIA
jgi:FtsP/CotA-like multicopper oxidase with cupredoxin domain